jgi:predicted DNA-binding transcriptional regulator AlpA
MQSHFVQLKDAPEYLEHEAETMPGLQDKKQDLCGGDLQGNIMSKDILTEKEAATYIGMSRSFLSQDRMNGYREGRTPGPVFMKLGRSIRYRKEDLNMWLSEQRIIRALP